MSQPELWLWLGTLLVSFSVTTLLVPLFRRLAIRLGIVDRPSLARKVHRRPVPYLGGLAFYLSFLVTVIYIEAWAPTYSFSQFYPMVIIGTCVVLLGVLDDILDIPSGLKLVLELGLVSTLYWFGFRSSEIASPWGGSIPLGPLAFFVTPLWIVGVMNAVNFSDGLDGLAAGLVLICALSIMAIAVKNQELFALLVMAYLIGTTVAFLLFNFHPASIFMGDAGALFLGFVLGSATLIEERKGLTVIALTVPLIVMGIPFVDTALSFFRRLQRASKGEFFVGDRDHLHHRLLALGLNQRQVVLTLYYLSAIMGLMAFVLSVVPPQYTMVLLLLAGLITVAGIIVLRFVENLHRRVQPPSSPHQGS